MKIVTGGRQSGKTTELIKMAAQAEAEGKLCFIVVHNRDEQHRIKRRAEEMGLRIAFPIRYDEFTNLHGRGFRTVEYLIDNVDFFLSSLFPDKSIKALTVTSE